MSEDNLQRAVAQYLDTKKLCWCHVPNGGYRNILEARKFKKLGVKPGVPDILIFSRPFGHSGMAIELKYGKNKTSVQQKAWLSLLESNGWITAVCYSIDEVMKVIEENY